MRKGAATRERILEIAEAAVLAKGFGATSIDEVIVEAGITKSGFFYHFKDKNELAREMVRRYVETNDRLFDEIFGRGRELSEDPLQAFLIGLKLLAEIMADLPNGHPGCLIASICYQERLFDREIRELNAQRCRRLECTLPRLSRRDRSGASAPRAGELARYRRYALMRRRRRHHHVEGAQRPAPAGASGAGLSCLRQIDLRAVVAISGRARN